jgi:hypothetical protein
MSVAAKIAEASFRAGARPEDAPGEDTPGENRFESELVRQPELDRLCRADGRESVGAREGEQ